MNAPSRRTAVVLSATTALVPLACTLEPATPELQFSLNEAEVATNEDLFLDPGAQAKLDGGLQFLFGTPQEPRYLPIEDWSDDGFNADDWGYERVFGDDDMFADLVESNRRTYAAQIAAIRAGDFEGVRQPHLAADLWARWQELLVDLPADPDADFEDDLSWRDLAVLTFEEYYPTLSTAAEMYRVQCFHCHGAEGGGDGSTAPFLNPPPRDYRPGKFKWTPLEGKARPRHEDLFRILAEGIFTTAMPNFRRYSDAQLHGLVDYVRLLAVRGETEILMITDYNADDGLSFEGLKENYQLVIDRWREAPDMVIAYEGEVPRSTQERIAHGRYLFTTPGEQGGANCVSCHGPGGRGDGPSVDLPENSVDDWGNQIKPRNLTSGTFRFGRRPIDLYRRIYAGINGTPMPEHIGQQITDEDGTVRTLNEDDIWDLAFFVRSLSTQPLEVAAVSVDDHSHENGDEHDQDH